MTKQKKPGIPYTPFPADLQSVEREKSQLLLEAHMLKTQKKFAEAAAQFAQAARYEQQLTEWASKNGLSDISYLHAFSALSCWANAGDPHRALEMSRQLLQSQTLSTSQRSQLQQYHKVLENRWVSWMQQWSPPKAAVA